MNCILRILLVVFVLGLQHRAAARPSAESQAPFRTITKAIHNAHPEWPGNAERHSGGPDAFGYSFTDSNEAGGPLFSWTDISSTGTLVSLSDDDNSGPITLPWSFDFYGQVYTELWICSNGYLQFGTGSNEFNNQSLPNATAPNNLIALFWDDLNPASGGSVYYGIQGGDWICQFEDVREYGGNGTLRAQIVLHADGSILLQYDGLENGLDLAGETIGIESETADSALQVSLDNSPVGYPEEGLAILINHLDPDASVTGFVRASVTNTPIAGAHINIGAAQATTAADGSYDIPQLFSGARDIHVSADGFYDYRESAHQILPGVNTFEAQLDSSGFPAGLVGYWDFNDSNNLLASQVGNDLLLEGTHAVVAGPEPGNGAVSIGPGSFYRCNHDIEANGAFASPSWVNQFCIVMDVRLPASSPWYSLYQTNWPNTNDADCFINSQGQMGVNETGFSSYGLQTGEWYRLAINANLGLSYDYFLDGQLLHLGGAQDFEGRFSLYPASGANQVLFFADNNGEDATLETAGVWIFDRALSAAELESLGGYGHEFEGPEIPFMQSYLQSPTPNSIIVNWHESLSTESIVTYGLTPALGQTAAGSTHTFDANTLWHKVQLTGLQADTEYYYSCKTDTAESPVKTFRTFPENSATQGHFRIGILGDTRTTPDAYSAVIDAMRETTETLYGPDVHNQLNLVLNVGDIVTSGPVLSQYIPEYFNPSAGLSESVPFMVSIGNHESEAAHYYNYMNYEDLAGPEGEIYYSFRAGPILFLGINSNTRGTTQLNWINDQCQSAQDDPLVDWVVAYCHHPGHSEVWPDGNTAWVQNSVIPILAQHDKVCGLYYGHSHDYEMGADPEAPFRMMLSGGGGSPLDRWGMYANQQDYPEFYKSWDHYGYTIIDFDLSARSYMGTTYSLGHQDRPLNNVVMDEFYQKRQNTSAPDTPAGLSAQVNSELAVTLVASSYSGSEDIMSSHFQVTIVAGDYGAPMVDQRRDWINVYGDTGAPDYTMVDLNEGIDLGQLTLENGFVEGQSYYWRLRYRDQNLVWSDWSAQQSFVVTPSLDLSITYTAGAIVLNWDTVPGALEYRVYSSLDISAPYTPDNSGVFFGNTWVAPIQHAKVFYRVTAVLE